MDARQQAAMTIVGLCTRTQRDGILEQWRECCLSEAARIGRPEFTQYSFRLYAARLEQEGRPVRHQQGELR